MKKAIQTPVKALFALALVCMPFASVQAAQTTESNTYSVADDAVSDAELAQMLAPIALYPDSLLTHILIASTYPLEIVQAQRWLVNQGNRDTKQIMAEVESQDWDPSVKALVAFPNVLERLNTDLVWTQNLGDAFLQDEGRMLDTIQALRQQADEANNLADLEQVKVSRVERRIIIESVRPEIVYVPYYDSRIVYGHWRWNRYPPVYWHAPNYVHYRPNHSAIIWDSGVRISFNFFFSGFHWHDRRVIAVPVHKNYRYYTPRRISYSHGAQHWQHKPKHRKGVAYRSQVISKRYNGHYEKRNKPVSYSHEPKRQQNHEPRHVSSKHAVINNNEPRKHITHSTKQDNRNERVVVKNVSRNEPVEHKSAQLKRELSQQRQPVSQAKSFERKSEPTRSTYSRNNEPVSRQQEVNKTTAKYEHKPASQAVNKPRNQEIQQVQRSTQVEKMRESQAKPVRIQQDVKQQRRNEPQQASRSMSQQRDNSARQNNHSREIKPSRERQ
ncbi:DUF3300 domain-containing protein [Shewanella inventionis]|uniref:DUF3300 domain-containing protein n=1 Tax=Shewanella inventionis TaxID=1738770 RepID=A0ABQ1IST9_9GAMM|nr:DUF3300 domain-containing protein [Shewanella inventionis]MCL1156677.1 DUF3300 domain-containing protein [Shewanella inventionis]UAL44890.1 DUF3300 domain-containing protein [Shewanella inventionis]GGB50498.1 hypothetical protein GCM10011607_08620 [Shewanella inventionis]